MLPGLSGVGGFIGIPDAFVGYAEATINGPTTTLSINKPTGTESGMILVAVLASGAAGGVTWTGDSGWTEIYDKGSLPNLRVAYLVAGGSEPASYTFTISGSTNALGQILCFRGYGYDTVGAGTNLIGNGALAITELTSAGGIIICAAASTAGTPAPTHTTPTGMTLIRSTSFNSAHTVSTWYQPVAASATGTRTTTVANMASKTSTGILVGLK